MAKLEKIMRFWEEWEDESERTEVAVDEAGKFVITKYSTGKAKVEMVFSESEAHALVQALHGLGGWS